MTKEDKELLLQDLCARLPYGVVCKDTNINVVGILSQIGLHYDMCVLDKDNGESESCYLPNCKPYLFPISSMTEEQREEFHKHCLSDMFGILFYTEETYGWLNANHFDYRRLINKGLAIDATGLNIY